MQETNEAQQQLNQFARKSKSSGPTDQVYPLFITLASTWYTWFDSQMGC
jgi:hypothetical protein